jgi:hypothetical protein
MRFQMPLELFGTPSIVIVTFTTATGVGQLQRRFKQYDPFHSAGSFIVVSVDNPTPPGQIL